jgi:RNA polymerase sigma factor (sigma-70 family)
MDIGPYLSMISKYSQLSPEQEVELARRIRFGDPEARDSFIMANLRLVVSVAKDYWTPENQMDLIQSGNSGLIEAVDRFDPERGNKFSTLAMHYIKKGIFQYFYKNQDIRIPFHLREDPEFQKLRTVTSLQEPVAENLELMATLGLEPHQERGTIGGNIGDIVRDYLAILSPRELKVIRGYFYEEKSGSDMADEMGISRQRVSTLYLKALKKLRVAIRRSDYTGELERSLTTHI